MNDLTRWRSRRAGMRRRQRWWMGDGSCGGRGFRRRQIEEFDHARRFGGLDLIRMTCVSDFYERRSRALRR